MFCVGVCLSLATLGPISPGRAQHGYTTLDKVTAIEASNVGAGYGELAGAQSNLLFCVKLVMPW